MAGRRLGEVGEFGLIRLISGKALNLPSLVVKGIGDDAAVLKPPAGNYLLATCDMMVEGSHFLLEHISPGQLGYKALAINFSDIAAMGGVPRHALVSLGLTPGVDVEFVVALYDGLKALASLYEANVVGGDTVLSRAGLVIDVMVLGEVEPERLTLRSGARPGDAVMVTGSLGDSAAGLHVLMNPGAVDPELRDALARRHLEPLPRLREARAMGLCGGVTAANDISDGLSSELNEIAEASGVQLRVWEGSIPISREAREAARAAGKDALEWALRGGEDYELVFTARRDRAEYIVRAVGEATGTPVSLIGEVCEGSGVYLVGEGGALRPLDAGGWNHFR